MNKTLIDAWFTVDQLKIIKESLSDYYLNPEHSGNEKYELISLIEHLEHLIEHYNED